jgi:hypothetical protein
MLTNVYFSNLQQGGDNRSSPVEAIFCPPRLNCISSLADVGCWPLGGKADMTFATQITAFDPKRTPGMPGR